VTLSAQTHAIAFYQKAGFIIGSDVYLDANIPHVDMQLKI
jgi:predicted GNAT family N-acyltransferase